MDEAQQIIDLKPRIEQASQSIVRLEALASSSRDQVDAITKELEALGFTVQDLERLPEMRREVEAQLAQVAEAADQIRDRLGA